MRSPILVSTLVAALALAACGGDDDDRSSATTREPTSTTAASANDVEGYCAQLAALDDGGDDGGDPGFDQFFADHPEPALADWASFLPGPIAALSERLEDFDAIEPPAELATEHAAVVDAMRAVRDSLQTGLDAAEAGDQEAFDANGQAPGDEMEAAMTTLGAACGLGE